MECSPQPSNFSLHAYDGTLDLSGGDLSDAASALLGQARGLAGRLRHGGTEPVHVLAVLFFGEDGGLEEVAPSAAAARDLTDVALRLLRGMGLSGRLPALQRLVAEQLGALVAGATSGTRATFTQAFVEWLKHAQGEQLRLGSPVIRTEHLILAFLRTESELGTWLGAAGLTTAGVDAAVDAVKVSAGPGGLVVASAEVV